MDLRYLFVIFTRLFNKRQHLKTYKLLILHLNLLPREKRTFNRFLMCLGTRKNFKNIVTVQILDRDSIVFLFEIEKK